MHTTLAVKIIMILAITIINNNIRGVCRISQGGGATLKFLGFCIYMPRSGMSRAAKLRAFARGVWGHAPAQENF